MRSFNEKEARGNEKGQEKKKKEKSIPVHFEK